MKSSAFARKNGSQLYISVILIGLCCVRTYAQLADTMLCADESCSETVSEGQARLAYRPRDNKFLNLKKGDVVLVKSKNAGQKSHLWGGQVMGSDRFGFFPSSFIKENMILVKSPKVSVSIQEFLKGREEPPTENPYAGLVGENQRITIEKSRKTKDGAKKKADQDEKSEKEEKLAKEIAAGNEGKAPATTEKHPEETVKAPPEHPTPKQEEEHMRLKRSTEEHREKLDNAANEMQDGRQQRGEKYHDKSAHDKGTKQVHENPNHQEAVADGPVVGTEKQEDEVVNDVQNDAVAEKDDGREPDEVESKQEATEHAQENPDGQQQPEAVDDSGGGQRHEESDGTVEKHESKDPASADGEDKRHLEDVEYKTKEEAEPEKQEDVLSESPDVRQQQDTDPGKQEDKGTASIPPDIAALLGDGVLPDSQPKNVDESPDSIDQKQQHVQIDQGKEQDKNVEDVQPQEPIENDTGEKQNEKDEEQDVAINKHSLDDEDSAHPDGADFKANLEHSQHQDDTTADEKQEKNTDEAVTEKNEAGKRLPIDDDDGPFEDDIEDDFEEDYDDDDEVEEQILTETGDSLQDSSNTDEEVHDDKSTQDSEQSDDGAEQPGESTREEHASSTQQPGADRGEGSDDEKTEESTSGHEKIEGSSTESTREEDKEQKSTSETEENTVVVEKQEVDAQNDPDEVGGDKPDENLDGATEKHDTEVKSDSTESQIRTDNVNDREAQEPQDTADQQGSPPPEDQNHADRISQGHMEEAAVTESSDQHSSSPEDHDSPTTDDTASNNLAEVTTGEKVDDSAEELIGTEKATDESGGTDSGDSKEEHHPHETLADNSIKEDVPVHEGADKDAGNSSSPTSGSEEAQRESDEEVPVDHLEANKDAEDPPPVTSEKDMHEDRAEDHAAHPDGDERSENSPPSPLKEEGEASDPNAAEMAEVSPPPDHGDRDHKDALQKTEASPTPPKEEHEHETDEKDGNVRTGEGAEATPVSTPKQANEPESETDGENEQKEDQEEPEPTEDVQHPEQQGLESHETRNGELHADQSMEKEDEKKAEPVEDDGQPVAKGTDSHETQHGEPGDKHDADQGMKHTQQEEANQPEDSEASNEASEQDSSHGADDQNRSESEHGEDGEQEQHVPAPEEEDMHDGDHKSEDTVLQMDGIKGKEPAGSEQEQISDPEQSDSEKYNALHEGQVVDWDETLEDKPGKEKSVGWDEALGGDDENDSQFAPPPTEEPSAEFDEGKEKHREDLLSGTPDDDVVTEPTASSPPLQDTTQSPPTTFEYQKGQPIKPEMEPKNVTAKAEEQEIIEPKHEAPKIEPTPTQEEEKSSETANETLAGKTEPAGDSSASDEKKENLDGVFDSEEPVVENEMHVESFWLRLLLVLSNFPYDVIYILEPFFNVWVSLLPNEYQNDVHGVSWTIILSTFFIGFALIWLLTCRSRSVKRRRKDEQTVYTVQELKTQLENLSQEKIEAENQLRTKENEVEIHREQMATVSREKEQTATEKRGLEHSLREFNTENEALKRDLQHLNHSVQEKDQAMQEVLTNSQQVEKSLLAQQEVITRYEAEIGQLQGTLQKIERSKKEADTSGEKLKERIKNLEKTKGETKKEGKVLKEQIDMLNTTVGELQEKLDAQLEEGEQKKQEIDILKDCILQFKGAQEYLTDEGEDAESEDTVEKQKEKMKSMVDVAKIKTTLKQSESEKLQITYELEAERKSKMGIEARISELEASIQSDQAVKDKLERDKQMLDSKLTVMQDFYAKREVEIQSKLGLEQSKRESNASLLEDQQKQQMEVLQQLEAYKKMSDEAKQQYVDAERQHKQEILGFEKKAHDNWLACRDAERKFEEANKQITQLQLELGDTRQRLRDSEREPILRPRPERHGPPGAPPPFGPPRRPPPPGMPGSPLHFRNGPPPDLERRSPPPPHRRPPSPGGSMSGDRPPSRPDRPPSTHSLPPMDRRPPGPPLGPGPPYSNAPGRDGRPYREGMPPIRPHLRDYPPHARPPPGSRMPSGPLTSSPYMERPNIPRSQSPRSQNFTQSSLHATPPHSMGEGLRNDGYQHPPPPPESAGPPPPAMNRGQNAGESNPFRRSRP